MRRLSFCLLAATLAAAALPLAGQTLIGSVPIGTTATYLAANTITNKIYVTNYGDGTVTVIDGATNATSTITVGNHDEFLVINSNTNKIYVNNRRDSTVSVINGANNTVSKTISGFSYPIGSDINLTTNKVYVANSGNGTDNTLGIIDGNTDTLINTITVGLVPLAVAVNPVTNKIYVINQCGNDNNCQSAGTVSVVDGVTNQVTSVGVGFNPGVILVNPVSNKIYVMNACGTSQDCLINGTVVPGTVTVIDGATNATATVNTGNGSGALAVNPVSNEAYVANSADNTVTFINGNTLATQTVAVGTTPADVEVNPATYKIYVTNNGSNTITMIDGATHHPNSIAVGSGPGPAAVNPVTNRYYDINSNDNTVSVVAGGTASALQFVALPPCRVVDTRNPDGSFGGPSLPDGGYRDFPLPSGACNIPADAAAYSLNVTIAPVDQRPVNYISIWPTGELQPLVSTMNSDGRVKANAAIVPAGANGAVRVFAYNATDVILDIDGYFTAPSQSTLQFYTLPPCRLVDTRGADGLLGGPQLSAQVSRTFPVQQSSCIPGGLDIKAYSLNFTAVPHTSNEPLSYLTVWPAGQNQPLVSTLNNPTGTIVANAAIVPSGQGGSIEVFASDETDLIIDVNGYFAPPGAGGLSLYNVAPCRALDTRNVGSGQPFSGTLPVSIVGSACAPPSSAQAYVLNATVVPSVPLGYLTLWPNGQNQPVVSTLNATDGVIASNMAVVPTTNGVIDAYATGLTQLILDISSYFAP